jgi:hypothetical protein
MPNILAEQRQEDVLIASVYAHCKKGRIEPPTPDRICRLVHTAIHRFDERLYDPKWRPFHFGG